MSPAPNPRKELTETALKLLAWAEQDLARANRSSSAPPRVMRRSLGPVDSGLIRQHAALLRMVAIVEAYLDALSKEMIHGYVTHRFQALDSLLEDFESNSIVSWEKRIDAFNRFHNIPLGSCSAWAKFDAAIVARNSVAHGLGRLTAQQQRKRRAVEQKLLLLGIWLIDGELRTGPLTLEIIRTACVELVRYVDARTP